MRLFVSSPGDVAAERERIDHVVERINHAFSGLVSVRTIRWEQKIYGSHTGFQEQIPEAAECDIVVGVFGARLGTPLPDDFARMENGERYPSGTAYEVLSALAARKKGDGPDVYVFRVRDARRRFDDIDETQYRDMDAFFARWFKTPDGRYLRARHLYETVDELGALVDKLLHDWIAEHVPRDRSLIWPIETKGSPFRGLLPFDAKHAAIYFGRDRKVTRAIEQFQAAAFTERRARSAPRSIPFLLIVGESGAGKSSLLRAGVAPRLTASGLTPEVDMWRTAVMRVGDDSDPFLTLASALLEANGEEHGFGAALPELATAGVSSANQLAALLETDLDKAFPRQRPRSVGMIVAALQIVQREQRRRGMFERRLRANLLLLVDQLENIFAVDEEQRARFARLLFALCATRRVWIGATLRSDFYPRLITPGDFLVLKDAGATYDLAAPGEAELTEIVQQSAAAAGLVYGIDSVSGERLDERLLRDAQGKNTLPLLQFALDRLFERRQKVRRADTAGGEDVEDVVLSYESYESMNGLDGAIDQAAETALGALGEPEIAALPRLLRSLAVASPDANAGAGRASELTLRAVAWSEQEAGPSLSRLVDALTEARVMVVTSAESGESGGRLVSLSHQRVLESWTRAREIVANHVRFFRIRRELENQWARWQNNGRASSLLLARGVPLAEARELEQSYSGELERHLRDFVAASIDAARRRVRRVMIGMSVIIAVLATSAIVAGVSYLNAQKSYDAARGALHEIVGSVAKAFQNTRGIQIKTVQEVLDVLKTTFAKLEAVNNSDPELKELRAEMLFQAGKTLEKKEQFEAAREPAQMSMDILSNLTGFEQGDARRFDASPASWRLSLSRSLELIGDIDREKKKRGLPAPEALPRFEKVCVIRRAMMLEDSTNPEWAEELTKSYTRIGDVNLDLGHKDDAFRNYRRALWIAARFFKSHRGELRWRRELSWMFKKLGDARLKSAVGSSAVAWPAVLPGLDEYDHSLCLRRTISADEEHKTEYKRDVGFVLYQIGEARSLLSDHDGAALADFEALAIRRDLSDSVKDDSRYFSDVADSLEAIGQHSLASGDDRQALAFLEGALEARTRLAEQFVAEASVAAKLGKVRGTTQEIRKRLSRTSVNVQALDAGWAQRAMSVAEARHTELIKQHPHDWEACWDRLLAEVDNVIDDPDARVEGKDLHEFSCSGARADLHNPPAQ